MSISGNNEKTQTESKLHIYDQMNSQPDKKAKMIYDRYRTGRSIIIDDLKYLWLKDPEGCEKLARSIVESKTGKGVELTPCNMANVGVKENTEIINEQSNYIDYKSSANTPIDTIKNFPEIMASVKLMIENMSDGELMDISKNLYDSIELKKLTKKMKDWDDTLVDKMVMYIYDDEEEFDILA